MALALNFEVDLGKSWGISEPKRGPNPGAGLPCRLAVGRSYASLINSPAMPKNTTAAPVHSNARAAIPVAATHMTPDPVVALALQRKELAFFRAHLAN